MIFFLTASFFLLITFLKYIDLNGIKKTNYYIPAAGYSIFQFYNYDLLATEFGRKLITPDGLDFFVDRLSFIGKRVIYSTMYNPNYVGSYASMLVILVLALYNVSQYKKRLFLLGIFSTLLFAF